MFTVTEIATGRGSLQYREENLTGFRCRISPERLKRRIDQPLSLSGESAGCPFCWENIFSVTPTFPNGSRILRGESVTFPNMFPFAAWHTVTVITKDHMVPSFSQQQITDALNAQAESLLLYDGYSSINWNYLPSAGASMIHPHMQGIADPRPTLLAERYLSAGKEYAQKEGKRYWDTVREQELSSDRYLFGDEILWSAHAVPIGEREVRAILPVCRLDELESYTELLADGILKIIQFYRKLGTYAFNMAIFFGREKTKDFSAFCSLISRINPNPLSTSDSAFMERLHNEPVILTLPEDLAQYYRNESR
ncbi:galactose-1-phosphate uridylyltransferase [Methanoregula sp.]|jgi:galactose-1-phosphate uridylyltransferase|uniref:galactose-1-phosphate uridylyltransferase n=1 Tax=Methanoregula sp. TaxID=2052170 RepID=UPI003C1BE5C5